MRSSTTSRHSYADQEAKRRAKEGRSSGVQSRTSTREDQDREAKRRVREGLGPAPPGRLGPAPPGGLGPPPSAAPAPAPASNEPDVPEAKALDDDAVALEAMAVQDVEDERMKQLEDANKTLQNRMEDMARIQRGEAPLHGTPPTATNAAEEEEEEEEEEQPKSNRNRMICCIILVLLVLGGAGAGAGIALGGGSEDPAPLDIPPTDGNTDAPKITELPSASPSGSPTEFLPYPPPEPSDCVAMANGNEVSGQEEMLSKNFTITFDTVLTPRGNPATLGSRLEDSMQSKFVPLTADCQNIARRKLSVEKYAIGNGIPRVTCSANPSGCTASAPELCYECLMTLELWLKDENIKNLNVITKIGTLLADDDLLQDLDIGDLIAQLLPTEIAQRSPTNAPTVMPSAAPSAKPSSVPSLRPSSSPSKAPTTGAPTPKPSPGPTEKPTPEPSPEPTPKPSPGPTEPPTRNPTPEPTPEPTPGPTPQPTPYPTPQPNPQPTPQPNPQPTPQPVPNPTNAPVTSPVWNPTPWPVYGPSDTPSAWGTNGGSCDTVDSMFDGGVWFEWMHDGSPYELPCPVFPAPVMAIVEEPMAHSSCFLCVGQIMDPAGYLSACGPGNYTFSFEVLDANPQERVYYGFASMYSVDGGLSYTCPTDPMFVLGGPPPMYPGW